MKLCGHRRNLKPSLVSVFSYFKSAICLFCFSHFQWFGDRHHVREPPEGGFKRKCFSLQPRLPLPQRVTLQGGVTKLLTDTLLHHYFIMHTCKQVEGQILYRKNIFSKYFLWLINFNSKCLLTFLYWFVYLKTVSASSTTATVTDTTTSDSSFSLLLFVSWSFSH